jgi:hypothetical protein
MGFTIMFNFLNNYTRILTAILFEGKLFEGVMNSSPTEGSGQKVKNKLYSMANEVLWEVYMTGSDKKDFLVHIEFDYEGKRFKAIIFMSMKLWNRLFGNLIPDQKWMELSRYVNALTERVDSVDWAQFVLEEGELE